MDLNDYQNRALESSLFSAKFAPKVRGFDFWRCYCGLGLAGEAGEYANKLKKVYRDNNGIVTEDKRRALMKELGGALWYIAAAADSIGYTLDEVACTNLETLQERLEKGTLQGDGDDR